MGLLVDQFLEALAEWSRRTGKPDHAWTGAILLWTGGAWRFESVGAIDPATVSQERRASMSLGKLHGHLTLDQVREDLQQLVDTVRMDEEFLIVSLIQRLGHDMEDYSEDYAKGLRKRRAEAERIEALLNDPEQLDLYLRLANEHHTPGEDSITEASLIRLAEFFRKWATPSLQDQRNSRIDLDIWRELAAPIIDPQNLRRFRKAFAEQIGYGSFYANDDDKTVPN